MPTLRSRGRLSAFVLQTHTIVQLLLLALSQRQSRVRPPTPILVTAETNVAVDNILRKLLFVARSNPRLLPFSLGPGGILRVGEPGAIGAGLAEYSIEAAVPGAKNRAGSGTRRK
jgi:hypothetical protein